MGRLIGGIVAGIVVGVLCILAIETIGHMIWPPPAGIDPADAEAVAAMPKAAMAAVVAAWTLGAFAGALTANLIARRALAGWIVVALLVAAVVANLAMIPHPIWVAASGIVLPVIAGWIATRARPMPM